MMKKIVCYIIIFCLAVFSSISLDVCAIELSDSELYSISAVLIDGDTGRILYDKNANEQRPMASTTKIMTLIIALEYGNLDDFVTVSDYASRMPEVKLKMKKGEQYKLEDLLYSLILESHNDSAVAIAEHIGGDVQSFAKMMNDKAKEIGLNNTYFITPNGLDAEDENGVHSTTAYELALLMKYCTIDSPAKEDFLEICQTREYSFTDYSGKRSFYLRNKNALLDMLDGVMAGKTGFTADAGYCYVATIRNKDKTYIIALLGCGWPNNKSYKWSDTKKLYKYGNENYDYSTILDNNYSINPIPVRNGIDNDYLDVGINRKVDLLLSDNDIIEYKLCIPDYVCAPIRKNLVVGCLEIYVNNELFDVINIYSYEKIDEKDFLYCLKTTIKSFVP